MAYRTVTLAIVATFDIDAGRELEDEHFTDCLNGTMHDLRSYGRGGAIEVIDVHDITITETPEDFII